MFQRSDCVEVIAEFLLCAADGVIVGQAVIPLFPAYLAYLAYLAL
jgi:hypothetical protein